MKILNMEKKIIIVFCLISVVLLGACSSEETITSDGNQVNAAKGLSFQFSEEAYVPGVIKNGTRSIMTPAPIDLGDGLIAEAHLESDTMVTTRVGGTYCRGNHDDSCKYFADFCHWTGWCGIC